MSEPARTSSADQPLDGLLDRVRSVVPLVASRAAQAERARKPDDDVIEALKETGVFRSFVPRRFGGYEIDMGLYVDIGVAVSEACASTGWITTFYMEHNWQLVHFSEELQVEVFSKAPFILAPGAVNPANGTATPVAGGYEVTGRWKFGTGVVHADWVLLSAMAPTDDGSAMMMKCLVPFEHISVADTWHVDGMLATGSMDMIAEGVFVPDLYAVPRTAVPDGAGEGGYMENFPMRPFLTLTAAIPSIGVARRAVELFRALLAERVRFGTTKLQKNSAPAQIRLARVVTEVRAAESTMRKAAAQLEAHARSQKPLSESEQMGVSLAIAQVVHDCKRIVRHVMEGSGASVHYLDHELQRINRDIQMIAAHTVFDLELSSQAYGRTLLEDDEPLF